MVEVPTYLLSLKPTVAGPCWNRTYVILNSRSAVRGPAAAAIPTSFAT